MGKGAAIGLLVLLLVVGGAAAGLYYETDLFDETDKPDTNTTVTASIEIHFNADYASGQDRNDTYLNDSYEVTLTTDSSTVLGLLDAAADNGNFEVETKYYSGMGSLVTAIAEVENGHEYEGETLYWIYYLNGEEGTVGAGSQTLAEDDLVEWKFETYE